jgi:hypothetical protein
MKIATTQQMSRVVLDHDVTQQLPLMVIIVIEGRLSQHNDGRILRSVLHVREVIPLRELIKTVVPQCGFDKPL